MAFRTDEVDVRSALGGPTRYATAASQPGLGKYYDALESGLPSERSPGCQGRSVAQPENLVEPSATAAAMKQRDGRIRYSQAERGAAASWLCQRTRSWLGTRLSFQSTPWSKKQDPNNRRMDTHHCQGVL